MRKLFVWLLLIGLWFATIPPDVQGWVGQLVMPSPAAAQATPISPPCGSPAWTASPGAAVNAPNINAEILHLEACAGGAAQIPSASPPIVATGSPPVFTIVTGNCLAILSGILAYTCQTPAPLYPGVCTSPNPTGNPSGVSIDVNLSCIAASGGGNLVVAGNCITTTPTATPAGGVIIAVAPGCTPYPTPTVTSANPNCTTAGLVITCVTPTPLPSPTSANANCSFSLVTLTCTTPTPVALPSPTSTAALCVSGSTPTPCPFTVSPNPFESAILARTDVVHFWKMHDKPDGCVAATCTPGPCPTAAGGITDAIAAGATAVPSPVNLTIGIGNAASQIPVCGYAPLLPNVPSTQTSILFCNQNAAPSNLGCVGGAGAEDYVAIPAGLFLTSPWTYGCLFNGQTLANTAATSTLMSQGSAGEFFINTTAGSYGVSVNATSHAGTMTGANLKGMMTFTYDGTTTVLYLNGAPITSPTTAPSPAATTGAFGGRPTTAATGWNGPMEDCWFANTAWSAQLVQNFFLLTGF